MKTGTSLLWIVVVAIAALAGWTLGRQRAASAPDGSAAPSTERRVLYYQSAMHPWIKSDRPGKCTICGMELTPVFEGEKGISVEAGVVSLSSNGISVLNVQAAEVTRGTLVRTLRVSGLVEDDDSRHRFLSATVGGRIDALHVPSVGAEVSEGQPLVRFFSPMLLEAERQFVALARGGGLAEESASLKAAAALRLRQLGLGEAQIEALPRKDVADWNTDLLSPASGTVVNRFVYPGQYVMEGEKLLEIADFSTMWFRFDAYEQDLPWLRIGQEVEVTTASLPGRVMRAPIRFIDPNLVEMTRSAKVRVELTNPVVTEGGVAQRLLRHRLFAEGRVRVEAADVLLVPRNAVLSPAGRPVVYVDRGGGAYEQRRIRLGRFGDAEHEVLEGLATGERVVVNGNLMIDAQAELNLAIGESPGAAGASAAGTPGAAGHTEHEALPALPETAIPGLRALFAEADAMRAALAADDLAGYRARATAFALRGRELAAALGSTPAWASRVTATSDPGAGDAATLREARRSFHAVSQGLVPLGQAARGAHAEFADIRIYQCPMTAEAFDGAPRRAQWLQLGAPLRNPWFGASMIDCGSEVKP